MLYLFAHKLPVTENGAYQGFWAQLNVFNAITGLGIALFAYTYAPAKLVHLFRSFSGKHLTVYFSFLMICGLLFGLLQYRNGLSLLPAGLLLILFTLNNIADTLLAVFRRATFLIGINVLYALGFFLLHIYMLEVGSSMNALVLSLLPLSVLKLLWSAWVIIKSGATQAKERQEEASHSNLSAMRKLWMHLYFYDIIQVSFLWLDKFIISLLFSKEEAAVYINGSLNIPFLPLAFAAVSSAALMQLSGSRGKRHQVTVMRNVGRLLSSMAFPLFFFLLYFRQEFIYFFFSEQYATAIPIFLCSILILPIRAYNHTIILQSRERGSIINRGAILDMVLAVLLMYPFYLWLGLPGVALSFVCSTMVQVVYYFYHSRKLLQVKGSEMLPLNNWFIKFTGFALLGFLLHTFLPQHLPGAIRLFTAGIVIGGIAGSILWVELKQVKKVTR